MAQGQEYGAPRESKWESNLLTMVHKSTLLTITPVAHDTKLIILLFTEPSLVVAQDQMYGILSETQTH